MFNENYTTDFNETVRQAYAFLNYPEESIMFNNQYSWIDQKSYNSFYDINHATQAYHSMIKELALSPIS